jgi:hypothetical protein
MGSGQCARGTSMPSGYRNLPCPLLCLYLEHRVSQPEDRSADGVTSFFLWRALYFRLAMRIVFKLALLLFELWGRKRTNLTWVAPPFPSTSNRIYLLHLSDRLCKKGRKKEERVGKRRGWDRWISRKELNRERTVGIYKGREWEEWQRNKFQD